MTSACIPNWLGSQVSTSAQPQFNSPASVVSPSLIQHLGRRVDSDSSRLRPPGRHLDSVAA
jgi:hypothetical protein